MEARVLYIYNIQGRRRHIARYYSPCSSTIRSSRTVTHPSTPTLHHPHHARALSRDTRKRFSRAPSLDTSSNQRRIRCQNMRRRTARPAGTPKQAHDDGDERNDGGRGPCAGFTSRRLVVQRRWWPWTTVVGGNG